MCGAAGSGAVTRCGASASRTSDSSRHRATRLAGDWLGAEGAPTILFYGHYDVQPVDPLDLWETPPFEATVRDGELYARRGRRQGSGLHALQGRRSPSDAEPPATGKHQILSRRRGRGRQRHLDDFIRAHKDELRADLVVISDTAMFDRGVPSICYGLRGLVYCQIDLRGSKGDMHSGVFGGAVANRRLSWRR